MNAMIVLKRNLIVPAVFGLLVAAGLAQAKEKVSDAETLSYIHEANLLEQQIAGVALAKSRNKAVLQHAEMLNRDHGDADQQVLALAQREGLALREIRSMQEETARYVGRLNALEGDAFDKEFLQLSVSSHEMGLQKLAEAMAGIERESVRQLAENLRPKLEQHLAHARAVLAQIE